MSADTPGLRRLVHDIRGPLSVIISYASLMADGSAGPLTPEQRQMAADMLESAREIAAAVEHLGALARAAEQEPPS